MDGTIKVKRGGREGERRLERRAQGAWVARRGWGLGRGSLRLKCALSPLVPRLRNLLLLSLSPFPSPLSPGAAQKAHGDIVVPPRREGAGVPGRARAQPRVLGLSLHSSQGQPTLAQTRLHSPNRFGIWIPSLPFKILLSLFFSLPLLGCSSLSPPAELSSRFGLCVTGGRGRKRGKALLLGAVLGRSGFNSAGTFALWAVLEVVGTQRASGGRRIGRFAHLRLVLRGKRGFVQNSEHAPRYYIALPPLLQHVILNKLRLSDSAFRPGKVITAVWPGRDHISKQGSLHRCFGELLAGSK